MKFRNEIVCKKNDEIELEITDLGTEGQGIGHVAGYTLFVKGALPGDLLRVKILKTKKQYGYARMIAILREAKDRAEPPCPAAGRCGGCQLQHLRYESQLAYKENKVAETLRKIAALPVFTAEEMKGEEIPYACGGERGQERVVMDGILRMNRPEHYRNKAQFPVGQDKNGRIISGFYAGRTHSIIPIEECMIQHPVNTVILRVVMEFMERYRISAYNEENGKGLLRHIVTRVGKATGEVMICLVINGEVLPHWEVLLELLEKADLKITSLCLNHNTKNTNVIFGERLTELHGHAYIEDCIGDIRFRISPLSFYQVNPEQTGKLYDRVLEYAGLREGETVWDLYCGIGTISLFLAKQAARVYGVEIVPQAVADAKENAKLNGITNAEFFVGAAEEVVPEKYEREGGALRADVVTLDPPRKGCDERLLRTVVSMQPERIVYVSCNPATLARDLKYLCANGYVLKRVGACDMFGMSYHVESVCLLQRRDKANL